MAKKLYLIDTSVILDDPQNIIYLSDGAKNILFISDIVLEELDKKKTSNEVGFLAREFFRNVSNESEIPSNQSAKQSAEGGTEYYAQHYPLCRHRYERSNSRQHRTGTVYN